MQDFRGFEMVLLAELVPMPILSPEPGGGGGEGGDGEPGSAARVPHGDTEVGLDFAMLDAEVDADGFGGR